MRLSLILLTSILFLTESNAQEYSLGDKRITLRSVSFQAGTYNEDYQGSLNDFKAIAPDSEVLDQDFSDFDILTGRLLSTSSSYSVLLGFDLLSREKKTYRTNPMIKVGISYFHAIALQNSVHSTSMKSTEAEFSDGPSGPIVSGTITEDQGRSSRFELESHQLRINGKLLLRSSQVSRLSVYGGVGFTLGHSIKTNLNITSFDDIETNYLNADGEVVSTYYDYQHGKEVNDAKGHFVSSLYLPLGMAFRLSKNSTVLNRIRIYVEGSPEIRWTSIPELRTTSEVSTHIAGGLAFTL